MGNPSPNLALYLQPTTKVPISSSSKKLPVQHNDRSTQFGRKQDFIVELIEAKKPLYPWANHLHKFIDKLNSEQFWDKSYVKYNLNLIDITNRVAALGILGTRAAQAAHEKRHPQEVFWRDGLNWVSTILLTIFVKKHTDKYTEKFVFSKNDLDVYSNLLNKIPNLTVNTKNVSFNEQELTYFKKMNILDKLIPLFEGGSKTINGNDLLGHEVSTLKEVEKILQAKIYKVDTGVKELFDKDEINKLQQEIVYLTKLKKKVEQVTDKLEWKSIKAPDWKRIEAEAKKLEGSTQVLPKQLFGKEKISLQEITAQIVELKTKSVREALDLQKIKDLEELERLHLLKRFNRQVYVGNTISTLVGLGLMILMGGILIPKFVFRYLVPKDERQERSHKDVEDNTIQDKISKKMQRTIKIISEDIQINR